MKKSTKNGSLELYSEAFGSNENEPILLIAGAMAPAVFWDTHFCKMLAERGYYVIRFDNRDIGKSTHFPQSEPGSDVELPYTIQEMVDDAKSVLDTHSDKRGHIVGHSLGASIAQLFAVTYPEKTQSLTVISGPILANGSVSFVETDPKITEELWAVLMGNPMYQDEERGIPEFRKVWRVLNGGWLLDDLMADDYTRAIYQTETIAPAWNHTHVQTGIRDIFQDLKMLNKPILFIHGSSDYLASNPENVKILAQALPAAELYLIDKGGHMFFNKKLWQNLLDRIVIHIKNKRKYSSNKNAQEK